DPAAGRTLIEACPGSTRLARLPPTILSPTLKVTRRGSSTTDSGATRQGAREGRGGPSDPGGGEEPPEIFGRQAVRGDRRRAEERRRGRAQGARVAGVAARRGEGHRWWGDDRARHLRVPPGRRAGSAAEQQAGGTGWLTGSHLPV